ncbi:Oidioi.mRNA.OKI2018_I69.chr2.g5894.t1.cds [Oikopleura dioica]|uniref:Oidioi.mRNA.OKI2018_I69.chr2.g5894.t1.cds n=1 Tax=Oikopleura dioica TaxID=34765 RepID=A0ABN7T185_OIKDI|nr:Oidioi.mRNA.OKI2018_I69.chr2.g5894.t1.cds [Oikopleura dioica]
MPNTNESSTPPRFTDEPDLTVSSSQVSEVEYPRMETTGRPRERESGTRARSFSAERVLNAEPVQFGRAVPILGEQVDARSRRACRLDSYLLLRGNQLGPVNRRAHIEALRLEDDILLGRYLAFDSDIEKGNYTVSLITRKGRCFRLGK